MKRIQNNNAFYCFSPYRAAEKANQGARQNHAHMIAYRVVQTLYGKPSGTQEINKSAQQSKNAVSAQFAIFKILSYGAFYTYCVFSLLYLHAFLNKQRVLRGYCTSGPYFSRICVFLQKIKKLLTKYPMALIRNVPRNSEITVLFQLRPWLWR